MALQDRIEILEKYVADVTAEKGPNSEEVADALDLLAISLRHDVSRVRDANEAQRQAAEIRASLSKSGVSASEEEQPDADNKTDRSFCTSCSAVLPSRASNCPECGAFRFSEKRFCSTCRASVKSSQNICLECGSELPNESHRATKPVQVKMFCTNCGNGLSKLAAACTQCGASPRSNNCFCRDCGHELKPRQVVCLQCGTNVANRNGWIRKRTTAALLAFFLGGAGIHKFYLGSWGWGILYVVFLMTGLPALVALVECFMFLTVDDWKFDEKYNLKEPSPFKW